MPLRPAHSLLLIFAVSLTPLAAAPEMRTAPRMDAPVVDQLVLAQNACGPAALINALRSGTDVWQKIASAIPGSTDREQIRHIARVPGMRASTQFPTRARWTRNGISIADLTDVANELAAPHTRQRLSTETFFRSGKQTPQKLLAQLHKNLASSLAKGFPPVISLRRYVLRPGTGGQKHWQSIDSHLVTLTSLPKKLTRGQTSFPITYIDPWQGRRLTGTILIPPANIMPDPQGTPTVLIADLPSTPVGKKLARNGELTALTLPAAMGRF